VHKLAEFISKHEAFNRMQINNTSTDNRNLLRAKCEKQITNLWGLTFHRGWARLLIERTALLIRKEIFNLYLELTDEEED